jgi:hypothetical protein
MKKSTKRAKLKLTAESLRVLTLNPQQLAVVVGGNSTHPTTALVR